VSYINCIETANPRYELTQEQHVAFYCNSITGNDTTPARKIRAIAAKSGIKKRYSVIEDFTLPSEQFRFFAPNNTLEPIPNLNKRMALYQTEALQLSLQSIRQIKGFDSIKHQITHLITVTCTGLFAPGLDIELIRELKLSSSVSRSSVNFMGCNAAILALKQAHYIAESCNEALVLIVSTELCTIHFQKKYEDEFLLSNLIFSDGSASTLVSSKPLDIDSSYKPIQIDSFFSEVIHEGKNDMAWSLSETGFIVNLTSNISALLNQRLPVIINKINSNGKSINHWAIHPGGKKILDDFCKAMSVPEEEIQISYDVLREKGNMSSPTILFVLKELLEQKNIQPNEFIFAAAFGPGLSLETVLLKA
jgi:alpha-pyrone synthase